MGPNSAAVIGRSADLGALEPGKLADLVMIDGDPLDDIYSLTRVVLVVKEGKVAWWRWLIGAFGVGTYRRDDQVDVRYELGGRPQVAHALDIEPPGDAARPGGRISEPQNLRNSGHRG